MSEANKERYYENLQKDIQKLGLDYNIWSAGVASKNAMLNKTISVHTDLAGRFGSAYLMGSFGGGKQSSGGEK